LWECWLYGRHWDLSCPPAIARQLHALTVWPPCTQTGVVETWCLESLTLLGTLQLPEEHITAMAVVPWTPFVLLGTARGRLHAVQCDSTGVPSNPPALLLSPAQ
jgi:hypothetical protein